MDPLSEIAAPGGGLSFGCADGVFAFSFATFIICDSLQKSSIAQKVYSHSSLDIYCIFLPKFMIYLFCGLARPFYWEGGEHHESIFISYPVRRSKHNLTLCLQVA